ncbi:hypothetical protein LshimejAT787_0802350 [Lyophyllum shimeji]|uniref:Uncharacterized protein n=1 Tax=Lyophyllum shimeji TaxID=47721 RepID=A0A9P3PRT5_LYOSH|nr:hypothetical protein LshimejAT787_0802350 [Lyophyllum shimeji]
MLQTASSQEHQDTFQLPLHLTAVSASLLLIDYHPDCASQRMNTLRDTEGQISSSVEWRGSLRIGLRGLKWDADIQVTFTVGYLYALALALISVLCKPRCSTIIARHLNLFLIALLAIYVHRDRDVLPLSTYSKSPLDRGEGRTILLSERKGSTRPLNPEETASLLSLLTFSHLDPLVFLGVCNRHLSFDQLPPLPDYDRASRIKDRAFRHTDIIFKLSAIFSGHSYNCFDRGEGAWFWILWLLAGPTIGILAFQWYTYFATYAEQSLSNGDRPVYF